ncbi:DUF3566 domain-containing protein [Phaeacidiphilus oryzae]|uniref:DUF3566 domain-containing protein n=1 Tax=Phaeacidiphilus oryzae TaxID=348818 RepID=UPI000A02233C|nr:DUF3566 domain-containing protein [Phaeacidiphilus oryzae]
MPAVSGAAGAPGASGYPQGGQPGGGPQSGYSQPTTYQKGGGPTAGRGQRQRPGGRGGGSGSGAGRGGRVAEAVRRAAAPGATAEPAEPAAAPSGRARRARLRIARADPWSVMKTGFLLAIAAGVITVVAVSLLWLVLDAAGVFSSLGGTISDATGSSSGGGFNLESYLSFGNVFLFTLVVAAVEIVLVTALATLGAFIYNICAEYSGGVEVTLAEED